MEDQIMEIKIKTPNERKSVKITQNASVKELRAEISKLFDVTEERLCLIFAGKILKDEDKLASSKIVDGVTVHLVVKQVPQQTRVPDAPSNQTNFPGTVPVTPSQPTNTSSNIFGQPMDFAGLLGNMNTGGNFDDMQRQFQQQLMSNPDMMRSMLENPLMQQLLQSPEVIQTMMQSNPQVRQLIERNPEVGHILNNPSLMRQTMEMMRNPAMMQELMRHHDRALLNAEAFPGGMNHLTRLYRDVQEPLMDATTGTNPFASLANRTSTTTNSRHGTENNEPLPNPWSSSSNTANTTANNTVPTTEPTNTGGNTQINIPSNLPSAENLHNLLGSFNDPRIQSLIETLRSNPQFTEMAIANSPAAANPQLQEQLRNSMPQVLQAFERPELRNALTNPRVLQAIFQIQQGLQVLQQEAPHLVNIIPGTATNPTVVPQAVTPTNPIIGGLSNNTSGNNLANNQTQMAQMLSSMMSIMSSNPGAGLNSAVGGGGNPEQLYSSELETMAQMGFPNRQANLRALMETFGDVNAAVNRILQFDP